METVLHTPGTRRPLALRCYLLEAKYEFLRLLRAPAFAVPALAFPVVFYLLFGVLLARGAAGSYMLVGYGVFGIMGPALFGFGVAMAMDRELGLLKLKRAMPVPPGAVLLAKMLMAMMFAVIITAMLMTAGFTLAGVRLAPGQVALLTIINVLGTLPFCAIGLYIGTLVSGQGAAAVVNLVYLPMAFLSGLWIPLSMLPRVMQTLAPVWPSYHLSQIALKVIEADAGRSLWMHLAVLALVTVAFLLLARRRMAH